MQKQEKQSSGVQRALQFSRTNPPRTLIPLNYNHVGAHNELLPCTEYEPQYSKLIKRVKKSIIHQNCVRRSKQSKGNSITSAVHEYR